MVPVIVYAKQTSTLYRKLLAKTIGRFLQILIGSPSRRIYRVFLVSNYRVPFPRAAIIGPAFGSSTIRTRRDENFPSVVEFIRKRNVRIFPKF